METKFKHSKFNIVYNLNDYQKILFNTKTKGILVIDESEFEVYNQIENIRNIDNSIFFNYLYKEKYIIDREIDEINILRYNALKERSTSKILRLTIAPTLGCNFKCPYCYEQQGREINNQFMNQETQDNLIKFVKGKAKDANHISVVWYGGEPLLGFDIIKNLTKQFIEICNENNSQYSACMVTNGYLLKEYSSQDLKELYISNIQVTLDGPEKIHDKRRILHNNKGTYNTIVNNLVKIQDDILLRIRVNLDKSNFEYIDELINDIESKGLVSYYLNIAPVENDEYPNDPKCLSEKEFTNIWINHTKKHEEKEFFSNLKMLNTVTSCCDADCENTYVIDNLGYMYKCWKDIGNINYNIGSLNEKIKNNKNLFFNYISYDATSDEMCKECKLLPICMGGCPYSRVHKMDRCIRFKYCLEDIIKYVVETNIATTY